LAPVLQGYLQAGLAPATQRSYGAAMKHFQLFCSTYNIVNPFPISELLLCYYVAYLAAKGLAGQTLKAYLAAVRNAQISLGLPDPREQSSLPLLRRVQAGIARVRLQSGEQQAMVRLPITAEVLARLYATLWSSGVREKVLWWAVACSAFFGFFRLGELLPESEGSWNAATDLAWGDVAVDSLTEPKMVRIHLKKSKADQGGIGADVVVGVSGTSICPVSALVQYLRVRGSSPGPFFITERGVPLVKSAFVRNLRSLLSSVGLTAAHYAGHSFRIGAATSAALAGLEDSTIQTLGRWHSAAFLRYIRTPAPVLASLSAALVRNGQVH